MTGYLVDTNIPSELTKPNPSTRIEAFLKHAGRVNIYLRVLSIGEICAGIGKQAFGTVKRHELRKWLDHVMALWFDGRVLPFTAPIAERWGFLTAEQWKRGTPRPVVDGMIAATAGEHGLTLVTRNVRDFTGLGVPLLNPWEAP